MYDVRQTALNGCLELFPRVFTDNRGVSIKPFHSDTFKKIGIDFNFSEDLMVTSHKGVLRGLHLQIPPFQQAKLIYCVRGSIFDVAVDIRKGSPTYGQHVSFCIEASANNIVYIPTGFAHGYLVLEDNTTVIYKLSSVYSLEHETGIRWDSAGIQWPLKNPILSDKDKKLPALEYFVSVF